MSTALKTLAIQYALANNWKAAQQANEELILENPRDLDSLNRLGFACIKQGKYAKARDIYKQVISLDKTNPIALKNLKRLETVSKGSKKAALEKNSAAPTMLTNIYIEEAGKTKTVELKNVADKKTLSFVEPGDPVSMIVKRSKIFIQTQDKKYIGMLPDNISMRLITFIKGGNEYVACIKAAEEKNISVFVKETKKSSKFKNQASFPSTFTTQDSE
ncbi:MAG TPA: tetratricopeptide repeat protein [Candidatus Levybacteria bacterium]|nr:tetratricopeptide repeat protein [Candidatus Levybacteria bacterium]